MTGTIIGIAGVAATAGLLLVAVIALLVTVHVARANFARQLWLEYLKFGFDNPGFGETNLALSLRPGTTVSDLVLGRDIYSQQYLWFLTITMDTCSYILRYLPKKAWKETVRFQIILHKPALIIIWPNLSKYYRKQTDKFVRAVLAEDEQPEAISFFREGKRSTPRAGRTRKSPDRTSVKGGTSD